MKEDTILLVKNRSAGRVVYNIPEEHIRREFAVGETKKITYGELGKLSYQPGGRVLMEQFLQIQMPEAIEDLNLNTEVEYDMSEEDIINALQKGSLDQFLDILDFAPIGVIDLVKKLSVSLPLTDTQKRDALKEKTGFDVDNALRHLSEEREDDKESSNTTVSSGRRTEVKYKVVEPKQ